MDANIIQLIASQLVTGSFHENRNVVESSYGICFPILNSGHFESRHMTALYFTQINEDIKCIIYIYIHYIMSNAMHYHNIYIYVYMQ